MKRLFSGATGVLLVLALMALVGCSSAATPSATSSATTGSGSASPSSGGSAVTIANFAFSPTDITVKTGATVTWTNNDSMAHTVTSDTGAFDSGSLQPGATYSHTFGSAGTFAYHCSVHPSMTAKVTVQ